MTERMSFPATDEDPSVLRAAAGGCTHRVCVIGGGMAGVLCAAQLTAQGIDNVLLEARQVGEGITKGTTAALTAQHDTLYRDIAKRYGMERARSNICAQIWTRWHGFVRWRSTSTAHSRRALRSCTR